MKPPRSRGRRRWMASASSLLLALTGGRARDVPAADSGTLTLCTFGDSVLDCARYNERGIHPGQLLVRNDDVLFPEFRKQDLQTRGKARLEHRAVDGATVEGLARQARGLVLDGPSVAIVTVGGNDLLGGLAGDTGPRLKRFEASLAAFLRGLPVQRVVLGTVYDPTFGDDSRNFLSVPAPVARANHRRVNEVIVSLGHRYGGVADLHAHFLTGDASWFTRTIEPSLVGASEIRRVFLTRL